jgi:hypothetical protein
MLPGSPPRPPFSHPANIFRRDPAIPLITPRFFIGRQGTGVYFEIAKK